MFSQEEKKRVIKIIEKARANALNTRAMDEISSNGLQLKLDQEDQAVADSLTEADILLEHQWLDRLKFISPEEKTREEEEEKAIDKMMEDWEEIEAESNEDDPRYQHDPRFDPEPLDDTIRFFSN